VGAVGVLLQVKEREGDRVGERDGGRGGGVGGGKDSERSHGAGGVRGLRSRPVSRG